MVNKQHALKTLLVDFGVEDEWRLAQDEMIQKMVRVGKTWSLKYVGYDGDLVKLKRGRERVGTTKDRVSINAKFAV